MSRRGRPGYDVHSLLAVSAEEFTRKGFDGTSMEDLAKRLGITKSAIYHHVAGKNQLLELAVGRALDGLGVAVDESRALDGQAIDRLEYLVRASVRVLVAEKPFVTLLLRVRGNTDVERRALDRRKEFDRYVADLVAQAADEGAVRPGLDPATTARLLFGMVNSLTEMGAADQARRRRSAGRRGVLGRLRRHPHLAERGQASWTSADAVSFEVAAARPAALARRRWRQCKIAGTAENATTITTAPTTIRSTWSAMSLTWPR